MHSMAHDFGKRLGYNEVSEKTAQSASCLNRKDFSAALATVRAALDAANQQERRKKYHR